MARRRKPKVPTMEITCRICGRTITIVWERRMGNPIRLCNTCAAGVQQGDKISSRRM